MREGAKMFGSPAKIILPMVVLVLAFVACATLSGYSQESENVERDAVLEEGFALLRAGNYGQAADAFKRADRLSKTSSPEAHWGLAQAYVGLRKFKDAVKSGKKAAALSRDARFEAVVRNLTGVALQSSADSVRDWRSRREKLEKAEKQYRKAIELDPLLAIAHFNLGFKLSEGWPNTEAFEELERYLELDPEGPEAKRARQIVDNPPMYVSPSELQSKLVLTVEPVYPPIARAARIKGTVVLKVLVEEEGTVNEMRVLSGHPFLVQAAVEAVQEWRYDPAWAGAAGGGIIGEVHVLFE